MADYVFELIISKFDDHFLFLEKAGEKTFEPAIHQNFDECWGVQDAVYDRKVFDVWKKDFLPNLLSKYNIEKNECKIKFEGPKEVHKFFSTDEFRLIFEPVGKPIKRIDDSTLYKLIDENTTNQLLKNDEEISLKYYTNKYLPKKQDELKGVKEKKEQIEEELGEIEKSIEDTNNDLDKISNKIKEEESNIVNKRDGLCSKLEDLYKEYSREIIEKKDKYRAVSKMGENELLNYLKIYFDVSTIRTKTIEKVQSDEKKYLTLFFDLVSLEDCLNEGLRNSLKQGKEHGLLKKNKWYEYEFDKLKFEENFKIELDKKIQSKRVELKNKLVTSYAFENKLNNFKIDKKNLEEKNRELEGKKDGLETQKSNYDKEISELEANINNKNNVEALNAR